MMHLEIFKQGINTVRTYAFVAAVMLVATFLSPTITEASFSYSKDPITTEKTVQLTVASTQKEDNIFIKIVSGQTLYRAQAYFTTPSSQQVSFLGNFLIPGTSYNVFVERMVEKDGPQNTTVREYQEIQPLPSFTTKGTAPASTTSGFSYTKPSTSTETTAQLSITSTKKEDNLFVKVVGGSQSPQYKPAPYTTPKSLDFSFTGLVAGTTYAVSLERLVNGAYQNVATLASFATKGTAIKDSGTGTGTTTNTSTTTTGAKTTCNNGIDDDKDGKIDYYGGPAGEEPDPSCLTTSHQEVKDTVAKGSLVPCTDKCSFSDVFRLINTILTFVLTKLLLPLFVLLIMYTGFQYLMAQGKPGMHLKLKSLVVNIVKGVLLILLAWLIVRSLLALLGVTDGLLFFD